MNALMTRRIRRNDGGVLSRRDLDAAESPAADGPMCHDPRTGHPQIYLRIVAGSIFLTRCLKRNSGQKNRLRLNKSARY